MAANRPLGSGWGEGCQVPPAVRRLLRGLSIGVLLSAGATAASVGELTPPPFAEPSIPWDPRHYVCFRAGEPPLIDGHLAEACWQQADWTEEFVDIEGPQRAAPRFRTRARMLWDDDYFYVGAEMEEPHVWATLAERDAVIYHDNDFEVFIDPDGDSHQYYELEINALGTEWDLFLVKPYRDGGPALNAWDIQGLRTGVAIDGTLNEPSDRDGGWSVEIALPWAVLRECAHKAAPPEDGDQWRVNFSRVEWRAMVEEGRYVKVADPETGNPLPEDNWVWSPQGLINMHYPEMWGFVQFVALPVGAGSADFQPDPEDELTWRLRQLYYRQRTHWSRHWAYQGDVSALGLSRPADWVHQWPPQLTVTPRMFEASLATRGGRRVHIAQDGRTWSTDH